MCFVFYQSLVPDSEGAHRKDVVDNSEGLGLMLCPLELWKLEYTNHMRKNHCAKGHSNTAIEVIVFIHGFGSQMIAGCGCGCARTRRCARDLPFLAPSGTIW